MSAFARFRIVIFGAHCERNSAARGELRGDDRFARSACFHKIVQDPVRDRFVKRALVPIRSEIKLERLTFNAKAFRNVINVYSGKIRLTGDRANRSEIVRFEMNAIIAASGGIRKSFESRLVRRSWNLRFASSENCQSTCPFCLCHSNIKVRPKAIEVNRPYLVEKRADRRPRPDIFRPMRISTSAGTPGHSVLEPGNQPRKLRGLCAYEKYCLEYHWFRLNIEPAFATLRRSRRRTPKVFASRPFQSNIHSSPWRIRIQKQKIAQA